MEWRWGWLWSIIWNILVHAVTLQWGLLAGDAESFKSWWRSLWGEIENRLNDLRSWANSQISWLKGYAFGQIYQLSMTVAGWITDLRVTLTRTVDSVRSWAQGQINWLIGLAYSLYNQARDFAQSIVNQVYAWVRPYVDSAIHWLRGLYEWIQPFRELITGWLMGARAAVDWLWHRAWGALQAFLANPIGFVLGWLFDPIRNLINWWQTYGPGLMTFVANELHDLRTTWENGKRILKALVDNPEHFIFDLLAPMFLDWLEQLIADNW